MKLKIDVKYLPLYYKTDSITISRKTLIGATEIRKD